MCVCVSLYVQLNALACVRARVRKPEYVFAFVAMMIVMIVVVMIRHVVVIVMCI